MAGGGQGMGAGYSESGFRRNRSAMERLGIPYGNYGASRREGGGIEPPMLAGNSIDNRIRWAEGLGKYDDIYDNTSGQWLWNMMGGPFQQGNLSPGPISSIPFLFGQPQGPDTNLIGGSQHVAHKQSK